MKIYTMEIKWRHGSVEHTHSGSRAMITHEMIPTKNKYTRCWLKNYLQCVGQGAADTSDSTNSHRSLSTPIALYFRLIRCQLFWLIIKSLYKAATRWHLIPHRLSHRHPPLLRPQVSSSRLAVHLESAKHEVSKTWHYQGQYRSDKFWNNFRQNPRPFSYVYVTKSTRFTVVNGLLWCAKEIRIVNSAHWYYKYWHKNLAAKVN